MRDRDRDDLGEPAGPQTSGKALASLWLSIGSWLCLPFVLAPPAFILGIVALVDIGRRPRQFKGTGLAVTGITFSAFSTAVYACVAYFAGGPIAAFFVMPLAPADNPQQVLKPERSANRDTGGFEQMARNYPLYLASTYRSDHPRCIKHLGQIAGALRQFHDVEQALPPAPGMSLEDPDPSRLSWRVGILPFIDYNILYQKFDQTAAWDTPANAALQKLRPGPFDTPEHPVSDVRETRVQVCIGPGTLFPDVRTPVRLPASVPDGLANTVLVVIASADPVPWTKPADIVMPPPGQPLPPAFKGNGGGAMLIVGMCDGSVRILDRGGMSDDILRRLIDPKDGQPTLPPGWPAR